MIPKKKNIFKMRIVWTSLFFLSIALLIACYYIVNAIPLPSYPNDPAKEDAIVMEVFFAWLFGSFLLLIFCIACFCVAMNYWCARFVRFAVGEKDIFVYASGQSIQIELNGRLAEKKKRTGRNQVSEIALGEGTAKVHVMKRNAVVLEYRGRYVSPAV